MELTKENIKKELRKFPKEFSVAFAYRCALRALPVLGKNGNFDFWKKDDRKKHIFSLFHALDFIDNSKISSGIKSFAAISLANSNDNIPIGYWENIDISKKNFLAPAVLIAFTKFSPKDALLSLKKLGNKEIDTTSLEYPVRMAARKLLKTANPNKTIEFKKIFNSLPEWIQIFFSSILKEKEFGDI